MEKSWFMSVVVPAHNEEKFLPECFESLGAQDYKGKYEIILADNNSSDGSREIAKKFGVRVAECKEIGIFYARQTGAMAAAGEIIVQADADTVYPKDWLSKISEHFSLHQKAVAVAGRFLYKDPPFWGRAEYSLRSLINWFCLVLFKTPFIISGANFAFKKEVFLKIGGYKKDSFSLDQYDIAYRLSGFGKVIYDGKIIAFTSSRRVKKPLSGIILDFFSNAKIIFSYFFKLLFSFSRKQKR